MLRKLIRPHRWLRARDEVRGMRGDGYVIASLPIWNGVASFMPMLVLLDLDRGCVVEKRRSVLPDAHHNLLLRIAVHEVEAWLLADHEAMAAWANIPLAKLPADADTIADPKRELVNLVRRHGPAKLRRFVVPGEKDRRLTAPGYNQEIQDLIQRHWDPVRAEKRSRSLARARERIAAWHPRSEPWVTRK